MKYCLKTEEPLAAGIVRVAGDGLGRAATGLADRSIDAATAVHDARKAFKRVRSLLRLSREALGEELFTAENAAVRDLGRQLAHFRDADALIEAFDLLAPAGCVSGLDVRCVRERLVHRRGELASHWEDELNACRRRVLAGIQETLARLTHWVPPAEVSRPLAESLKKAFRKARRAMRQAHAEPTRENLHEWRKQTKHCWYMAELLAEAWPELGAASAKKLERLADRLGEDHDLALLDEFIARHADPWPQGLHVAGMRAVIATRRAELEAEAFRVGRKALKKRPRQVRSTLKALWRKAPVVAPQLVKPQPVRAGAVASAKPRAARPRRQAAGAESKT